MPVVTVAAVNNTQTKYPKAPMKLSQVNTRALNVVVDATQASASSEPNGNTLNPVRATRWVHAVLVVTDVGVGAEAIVTPWQLI